MDAEYRIWVGKLIPRIGYGVDSLDPNAPDGDGERQFVTVHIGARGSLSKGQARIAGKVWREAVQRHPKAMFVLVLNGYAEDPREIWEIPEAARYVRWWAMYAGMDDPESADRFLGPSSAIGQSAVTYATAGFRFLCGCGVFGDEVERHALARITPTPTQ